MSKFDVAILGRLAELTPDEITALYNTGLGLRPKL